MSNVCSVCSGVRIRSPVELFTCNYTYCFMYFVWRLMFCNDVHLFCVGLDVSIIDHVLLRFMLFGASCPRLFEIKRGDILFGLPWSVVPWCQTLSTHINTFP